MDLSFRVTLDLWDVVMISTVILRGFSCSPSTRAFLSKKIKNSEQMNV